MLSHIQARTDSLAPPGAFDADQHDAVRDKPLANTRRGLLPHIRPDTGEIVESLPTLNQFTRGAAQRRLAMP
jgi:hypothetical protein